MDNKENLLAVNMLEPLENYSQSRRKRASEDTTCQVARLQALNRELRQQLEAAIRQIEEKSESTDVPAEDPSINAELSQAQQRLEESFGLNERLQEEITAVKRMLHDARSELSSKASALAVKERDYSNLLMRSKDQNSRITELETYRLKYDGLREKQSKLEAERLNEVDQRELKLTATELENQYRQMKVSLADCQFELKKITEDSSTYRTLAEMEKVRISKEHESRLTALRKHAQEENANWIKRFEVRDEEFHKEVEAVRLKYGSDRHTFEATLRAEMAEIKKKVEQDRDTQLAAMRLEASEQRKKAKADKEEALLSQKTSYEEQLERMRTGYESQMSKLKKEYEINLCSAVSERKTEETLHMNTRQQLASLKEKLYDQIYKLRKEKSGVEELLRQANETTKQRDATIAQLEVTLEQTKEQHSTYVADLIASHQQTLETAKEEMKQQLAQLFEQQLTQTEELAGQLRTIESTNQQQSELYQKQVDQLSTYFEERPSRQEDLRTIQELEQKLLKKQADVELLSKELKWHRLELENKEETYNRIFANGINEVRIPTEQLHQAVGLPPQKLHAQQIRDFKFRKMARSLLQQREPKSQAARKEA